VSGIINKVRYIEEVREIRCRKLN